MENRIDHIITQYNHHHDLTIIHLATLLNTLPCVDLDIWRDALNDFQTVINDYRDQSWFRVIDHLYTLQRECYEAAYEEMEPEDDEPVLELPKIKKTVPAVANAIIKDREKGYTVASIAHEHGVSVSTVERILRAHRDSQ